MGSLSIWHMLILLAVVLLVFGTGRVSNLMGDVAKGVKAFKKGLADEDGPTPDKPKVLSADEAAQGSPHKDEAHHH